MGLRTALCHSVNCPFARLAPQHFTPVNLVEIYDTRDIHIAYRTWRAGTTRYAIPIVTFPVTEHDDHSENVEATLQAVCVPPSRARGTRALSAYARPTEIHTVNWPKTGYFWCGAVWLLLTRQDSITRRERNIYVKSLSLSLSPSPPCRLRTYNRITCQAAVYTKYLRAREHAFHRHRAKNPSRVTSHAQISNNSVIDLPGSTPPVFAKGKSSKHLSGFARVHATASLSLSLSLSLAHTHTHTYVYTHHSLQPLASSS